MRFSIGHDAAEPKANSGPTSGGAPLRGSRHAIAACAGVGGTCSDPPPVPCMYQPRAAPGTAVYPAANLDSGTAAGARQTPIPRTGMAICASLEAIPVSGTAVGARQTPIPRTGMAICAPLEAIPVSGMAVGALPEADSDSQTAAGIPGPVDGAFGSSADVFRQATHCGAYPDVRWAALTPPSQRQRDSCRNGSAKTVGDMVRSPAGDLTPRIPGPRWPRRVPAGRGAP